MADPIQVLYDKMTEDGVNEARNFNPPPVRFRASEAADCLKAIWFRLRGQRPAPRDATSSMYGIMGDVDHDITRQMLNGHGVPVHGVTYNDEGVANEKMLVRQEFDVDTPSGLTMKIMLTSRADGEIDLDTGRALMEIKGTGFYPYKNLNEAFERGGHDGAVARVKDKHRKWYWQCQVTMALTGHTRCYLIVKDRSSGTLGVYDMDTGERSGITLDFDPEVFQLILRRFGFVMQSLKSGEAPLPEYTAKSNECKYCSFYYACHGAIERAKKGLEPTILYPGPQFEEYIDPNAEVPAE